MITRRRFLQGMGAAGVAVGLESCAPAKAESVAIRGEKKILVIVNIDGGYDWLNVLPPLSAVNRSVYANARPTLAIPTTQLLDLGSGVGLNTDLTGFDAFWTEKRVAFLPGIGMNNPNLSHFISTDLWGQGAAIPDGSGWLGRFADAAFAPADVLRGITVTNDLPVMLRGHDKRFVAISGASGFVYPAWMRFNNGNRLGSPWEAQLIEDAFARAVTSTAVDVPALVSLAGQGSYNTGATAGRLFYDAQNGFGVNGTLPARTPAVPYPGDAAYPVKRANDNGNLNGSLASQFKLIARMLAAGVDAQVFFTRLGGWDTHSNQAIDHPNLQRALGGSIRAFHQDLASIGSGALQDKVAIMAWSEFGRRVPENNGGTDHGTAGLAFVVGNAVNGGLAGFGYPNLAALDGNQNMIYTTDFRSLYATLLERWLQLPPGATDAVLGAPYQRLGFL